MCKDNQNPDPEFNQFFFSFREHLRVKNYSPASISAYSHQLGKFMDYLKEQGINDLKRVNSDILKNYQLKITEKYGWETVSMKLRAIKRFFQYLEENNYLLINPAKNIRESKRGERLPKIILSEAEMQKILDQPDLCTRQGIRDRTILEVFYSTGIRLNELTQLTIYDCDLSGGLLRINKGKGAKDRVVPLGRYAVRFLKEYITKIRPHYSCKFKGNKSLFLQREGKSLSGVMVQITIRKYVRSAGIKKKASPHTFRHTFATQLVRNGADITAVQRMLGHADLSVTSIYTKVAGKEVKDTHDKHHPRENDKNDLSPNTLPDLRKLFRWDKR